MPNVINGTSTGSGGLITTGDDSGILNIQTNEVTAITVDASQNVGVGVTPSAWTGGYVGLQVKNASLASYTSGAYTWVGSNWYNNAGNKYIGTGFATLYEQNDGKHSWSTAASGTAGNAISFTQAMTLDASGNLLVGTTTAQGGTSTFAVDGNVKPVLAINNTNSISQSDQSVRFVRNSSTVGTITTTLSATAYNTSSDYRLKNTITPMTGALAKVAQLKPVTYKWNVDGSDGQGFIAHELAEVVPDCVTGEKDGVETYTDEDGNEQTRPKYQGIDVSFLVATLTAAIQEQQAIIETLTQRITALEGA